MFGRDTRLDRKNSRIADELEVSVVEVERHAAASWRRGVLVDSRKFEGVEFVEIVTIVRRVFTRTEEVDALENRMKLDALAFRKQFGARRFAKQERVETLRLEGGRGEGQV